ncbi:hypothetical protein KUTeg_024498 [Tegillarca granosa]|uniref:AMOP domain-containing protein n=1 Tax=Tegillarca granosa TaxID=220873 RepID=A0ABQ9DY80_TEGGR|nr:hypothetical protein KUTeg_024498 [Tegillarca granosa]
MIGFSSDARYNHVQLGSPTIQVSVDRPFIAPFGFRSLGLAETLNNGQLSNAQIFYKVLLPIPSGNNGELKNLSSIIRRSVVGSKNFEATWGLTVTWMDVVSLDDARSCPTGNVPCPSPIIDERRQQNMQTLLLRFNAKRLLNEMLTSTFQATILTDGTSSFSIFNYEKMSIQIPSSEDNQAGFNGGNGFGWTKILQRSELQRANTLQMGEFPGRIIYKISGEQMIRGGCLPRNSYSGKLEMFPILAGMYGGEMLQVSGKCLQPQDAIICKFGSGPTSPTSPGYYVNSMQARCAVPRLIERGLVMLSLSVDGGNSYTASSYINIIHPSRMNPDVQLKSGWNETSPDYLTLNWDGIDRMSNSTSANVNVYLVGYRETDDQNVTGKEDGQTKCFVTNGQQNYTTLKDQYEVIWRNLKTLGSNIPLSTRTLRFRVRDFDCIAGMDCTNFEIGIVEVRLVNETDANMYRSFNSRVMPLGWFMNSVMFQKYGRDWPHSKCVNWYNVDKQDMTWMDNLLSCPCRLEQAIVDIGRFQPDVGCNMFDPIPDMCHYHIGAVHCVRAVQPTPKGSGNQCCYGSDGLLKYAADSFQGSTPDRSHDWGSYPYNGRDLVPSLSHWKHDVITFYYCCLWTGYKDCDYYMDMRATKDCTGYRVPRAGDN